MGFYPCSMPKSYWNTAELLPLSSDDWDEASLCHYFKSRRNVPELDAWLLSPQRRGMARTQMLLRCARLAHSYVPRTTGPSLLIGIPLVIETPTLGPDWRALQHELEAGLAFATGGVVQMCRAPVGTEKLHAVGPSTLSNWVTSLTSSGPGDPSAALASAGPLWAEGAYVWVGVVTMPAGSDAPLEELFFKVNAEISRRCRQLLMRVEALAEEQGGAIRLFPPTAFWNALSLSRLLRARMALYRLPDPAAWTLEWEPGTLRATAASNKTLAFSLPEEIEDDLLPLLQGFSKRGRAP